MEPRVFRPARSAGTAWLMGMSAFLVAVPVLQWAAGAKGVGLSIFTLLCGLGAVWLLLLAFWFPTMRYELDRQAVTLIYGPILRWRIPLREIRRVELKDLAMSVWVATRLPGIALFSVHYADVGVVRMCATRASKGIVLIETTGATYGVTPEDAEEFRQALQARAHG